MEQFTTNSSTIAKFFTTFSVMAPFPTDKQSLLERLISNGDMDGVGAATAKKRWPAEFGSIPTKALNNKIRTVRQKVLQAQLLKGT